MKNPIRFIALVAAIAASAATAAIPEVSGVTMAQPGTRKVTIAYTLSGGPAVVTFAVQTNANVNAAADDPGWTSIGGEAVCNAKGDVWKLVTGDGAHAITWRPDETWPDHVIPAGGARAVVTAWSPENPPPYMVVDLSAGALPNTQRYYPAVDFLPGGLLGNDDYRTTSLVMRKCPAAGVEWTMGSVAESGRSTTNGRENAHKVTLADNYYLGVFPVTQSQYALVKSGTTRPSPSCFQYEADKKMRPVENICWNEVRCSNGEASGAATYFWPNAPHASSFLGCLRAKTGIAFDMPSEAQWEFACRAGNGEGKWGDGSDYLSSTTDANLSMLACYGRANIQNSVSEGNTTWSAADGGTTPVGTYAPNAWGFYDMNGNIYELCLDWFEDDITGYGGAINVDSAAPANNLSGSAGTYRVWRVGSYRHGASGCRAAARSEAIVNGRYNICGVRVACPAAVATAE